MASATKKQTSTSSKTVDSKRFFRNGDLAYVHDELGAPDSVISGIS